jgi:hypothetical protein
MGPDPWIGAVDCRHRGILARASTVATWATGTCCDSSVALGPWQCAVDAANTDDAAGVLARIDALRAVDQPASATMARLSREDLPSCSVLISDGRSLAALSWGVPLGLIEIDRWEYAVTSGPVPGSVWTPLIPGTILDLADCGPTVFSLPCPHAAKEPA